MASSLKAVEFQHNRITWITIDFHLRFRTRRIDRPTLAQFKARLFIGSRTRVVRCLALEGHVRAMLVVPIEDQLCLVLVGGLFLGNDRTAHQFFERSMETLHNSNAAVLANGTESRQVLRSLVPISFEVVTVELAAVVYDDVLRRGFVLFKDAIRGCPVCC